MSRVRQLYLHASWCRFSSSTIPPSAAATTATTATATTKLPLSPVNVIVTHDASDNDILTYECDVYSDRICITGAWGISTLDLYYNSTEGEKVDDFVTRVFNHDLTESEARALFALDGDALVPDKPPVAKVRHVPETQPEYRYSLYQAAHAFYAYGSSEVVFMVKPPESYASVSHPRLCADAQIRRLNTIYILCLEAQKNTPNHVFYITEYINDDDDTGDSRFYTVNYVDHRWSDIYTVVTDPLGTLSHRSLGPCPCRLDSSSSSSSSNIIIFNGRAVVCQSYWLSAFYEHLSSSSPFLDRALYGRMSTLKSVLISILDNVVMKLID